MMEKKQKIIKALTVVFFAFVVALIFINIVYETNVKPNKCYGIGVDSNGWVYIAKDNVIEIYDENHTLSSIVEDRYIGPKTRFTIENDFMVIITAASGFHYRKLNLEGKEVDSRVYISEEEYDILKRKSYKVELNKGDIYEYDNEGFQYKILLNGETIIYQEPLFNAIIKRAFWILLVLTFATGIFPICVFIKRIEEKFNT